MKRFMTKKVVAIGLTAGLVLGAAGVAYAYFTSTGSGTGSAAVGTAGNDITVVGTETTPVFPGGATGSVTFTALNGGTNPERLRTIVFVSASGTGCSQALGDFSMITVTVNQTIPTGGTPTTITNPGTLVMGDTGTDQTPCEGAALTLAFTTS